MSVENKPKSVSKLRTAFIIAAAAVGLLGLLDAGIHEQQARNAVSQEQASRMDRDMAAMLNRDLLIDGKAAFDADGRPQPGFLRLGRDQDKLSVSSTTAPDRVNVIVGDAGVKSAFGILFKLDHTDAGKILSCTGPFTENVQRATAPKTVATEDDLFPCIELAPGENFTMTNAWQKQLHGCLISFGTAASGKQVQVTFEYRVGAPKIS